MPPNTQVIDGALYVQDGDAYRPATYEERRELETSTDAAATTEPAATTTSTGELRNTDGVSPLFTAHYTDDEGNTRVERGRLVVSGGAVYFDVAEPDEDNG